MERLTKSDSDYCHDICGSVNGCPRLVEGGKRCRDYDLYERLKWYEDRDYKPKTTEDKKITHYGPVMLRYDPIKCEYNQREDTADREVVNGNE